VEDFPLLSLFKAETKYLFFYRTSLLFYLKENVREKEKLGRVREEIAKKGEREREREREIDFFDRKSLINLSSSQKIVSETF